MAQHKHYLDTLFSMFGKQLEGDQLDELCIFMDGILEYKDVNECKNYIKKIEVELDRLYNVCSLRIEE